MSKFIPSCAHPELTQYSIHMKSSLFMHGAVKRFKLTCPDGFSVEVVEPVWNTIEWNDDQTRYQTHTPDENVYVTLVVNKKDLLIDCIDVCCFRYGGNTEYKFMNYETVGHQHRLSDVRLELTTPIP